MNRDEFCIMPRSEPLITRLSTSRLADARCAYTSAKVAGPEPDVVNHSFLTPVARDAQTPAPPATIRVAEPRNPEPARAGRVAAMPTLRTPSVPAFPEAPDALVIPRAAAVRHHVSGEGWGVAAAEGTFTTTTFTTRGGSKFVGGATTGTETGRQLGCIGCTPSGSWAPACGKGPITHFSDVLITPEWREIASLGDGLESCQFTGVPCFSVAQ